MDYSYVASGPARRFFEGRPAFFVVYDCDVSTCPFSILAIPFVVNFEPIAWFAGFEVHVQELDCAFFQSRASARELFERMYPGKISKMGVCANRLVSHKTGGHKSLILYSGGLDAVATFLRHMDEPLALVTVKGADIDLDDDVQWQQCLRHITSTPLTASCERHIVVSNLREFYTEKVDAELLFGWWGRVQHGHGLLGLLAPLGIVLGANRNYIASSYNVPMSWGSTCELDELLSWADARCIHDAARLSRQQKAELVVSASKTKGMAIPLRVCYSEAQRDGNCGRCEKCYRTILNLVTAGADPRLFGLPMHERTYSDMFKLMLSIRASHGLAIFWGEISSAARTALAQKSYFVFRDSISEALYIQRIAAGEIDLALAKNLNWRRDTIARLKFIARIRHPLLYRYYRLIADKLRKLFR